MADLDVIIKNIMAFKLGFKRDEVITDKNFSEIEIKFIEFLDSCNLSNEDKRFISKHLSNPEIWEEFRLYTLGLSEDEAINKSLKKKADRQIKLIKDKNYYFFLWGIQFSLYPNRCKNKFYYYIKNHTVNDLNFICSEIEKVYGSFKKYQDLMSMMNQFHALAKVMDCEMTEREKLIREIFKKIFSHHAQTIASFLMIVSSYYPKSVFPEHMTNFMEFLSEKNPTNLLRLIDKLVKVYKRDKVYLGKIIKDALDEKSFERIETIFKLNELI